MPYTNSVNEDFFSIITESSAYVLGWVYSDGNLRKNRFQFKISSNDIQAIELIKKLMGANHKIYSYLRKERTKKNYSLVIDSKKMYNNLIMFGLTPDKSKTIRMPIFTKHIEFFLRGFFEGDGSVWIEKIKNTNKTTKKYSRLRISFTSGSKLFLEDLRKKLFDVLRLKMHVIRPNHSAYSIEYSTKDSLKFLEFIYTNLKEMSLTRKLAIFENFKSGVL